MDIILVSLLAVILKIVELYQFFLIVHVIISWLEAFNVINRYNPIVYSAQRIFYTLYEPILSRLRRILPDLGSIDLSPLALLFMLYFLESVLSGFARRFPM